MSGLSLLERPLVIFNFLPSKTLHPARMADYEPWPRACAMAVAPTTAASWHRHWSAAILLREGLHDMPVTDGADAGLDIAVLPQHALTLLVRRMGVALCAPRLRHAITGSSVRALQDALGPDVLHWIRDARAVHPGLPGAMFGDAAEARRDVDLAGYASLYLAFRGAPPALARRLFLKLPPLAAAAPSLSASMANDDIVHAVSAAIDSDGAMALARAVHGRPLAPVQPSGGAR
ncbi:hypothetical protein CAL12_22085 [Bordetella genomosp. 8]|uniref:Uncharacterized protein n=1 Tax=Bordetella genomosp. 8 TaxID=1416806 RepID=A0A1W6YQ83_9BORD|nr:SctK family type III secretion system sorting platform protein [Bordetella genomosp. 8]ARP83242.1 hypothetical protein CAL12_22085 [Bordetella genomosp. 8]